VPIKLVSAQIEADVPPEAFWQKAYQKIREQSGKSNVLEMDPDTLAEQLVSLAEDDPKSVLKFRKDSKLAYRDALRFVLKMRGLSSVTSKKTAVKAYADYVRAAAYKIFGKEIGIDPSIGTKVVSGERVIHIVPKKGSQLKDHKKFADMLSGINSVDYSAPDNDFKPGAIKIVFKKNVRSSVVKSSPQPKNLTALSPIEPEDIDLQSKELKSKIRGEVDYFKVVQTGRKSIEGTPVAVATIRVVFEQEDSEDSPEGVEVKVRRDTKNPEKIVFDGFVG
jgi:hypothetical protein